MTDVWLARPRILSMDHFDNDLQALIKQSLVWINRQCHIHIQIDLSLSNFSVILMEHENNMPMGYLFSRTRHSTIYLLENIIIDYSIFSSIWIKRLILFSNNNSLCKFSLIGTFSQRMVGAKKQKLGTKVKFISSKFQLINYNRLRIRFFWLSVFFLPEVLMEEESSKSNEFIHL